MSFYVMFRQTISKLACYTVLGKGQSAARALSHDRHSDIVELHRHGWESDLKGSLFLRAQGKLVKILKA